ncbi:hypothetical protein PR048_017745 [Dryococelus australis]|uniref:Uncharacterized protein n=1 Tax=Dryococelus australis TaxID=614101 RepID=A0ABQ9HAG2_9NEOP|nr:hypothetical protein PR048_017745 [Dryococelus australis]
MSESMRIALPGTREVVSSLADALESTKCTVAVDQTLLQWPPCSLDLTPCNFLLCGYIKDQVYGPPLPQNLYDLRHTSLQLFLPPLLICWVGYTKHWDKVLKMERTVRVSISDCNNSLMPGCTIEVFSNDLGSNTENGKLGVARQNIISVRPATYAALLPKGGQASHLPLCSYLARVLGYTVLVHCLFRMTLKRAKLIATALGHLPLTTLVLNVCKASKGLVYGSGKILNKANTNTEMLYRKERMTAMLITLQSTSKQLASHVWTTSSYVARCIIVLEDPILPRKDNHHVQMDMIAKD